MSKSKKGIMKNKVALAIALALGCSMMGVASAATIDMNAGKYADGITVTDKNYTSGINDDFMYTYDAGTGKLLGGQLHLTEDAWKARMNGALMVRATDLPDLSSTTVNKIFQLLTEKYQVDEYNNGWNNVKLKILDADGNVIRQATMELDRNDLTNKETYIAGAVYNQVLSNDGSADQYDISHKAYKYGTWDVPAESIFIRAGNYEITPDLSKEAIKAAVKGAEKNLTVTNVNNASYLKINALGGQADTVYGIYNDKKGFVTVRAKTVDITASGNADSNALYAANNGDYTSEITVTNTDSRASAIKADGDVVNAGKNGIINLLGDSFSLESATGNIFYAHDGGVINAATESGTTLGLNAKNIAEGKYLALAEKGSEINMGATIKHLDDIDYDMVTVLKANNNITGDIKADADSKITFGMQANAKKANAYTGNVEGNVNLYLKDGITWNGYALDDNASLYLINGSVWNMGTDNAQHLKNLSGGESASQRSYINVGQGNISIDKYSGTNTFVYQHDASDPTKIIGGDVTIKSAEPYKIVSTGIGLGETTSNMVTTTDSNVYVQTSIDGIDTNNAQQVNDVLDRLAKKITYLAYADGERNLSGRVELAEGLTTASITKYYQGLTFDEKTGQGKAQGEIHNPYSTIIMGNPATEKEYSDIVSGSAAEGNLKYTFDSDTLIEAKITQDPRSFPMGNLYCAAINNYGTAAYRSQANFAKNGPSFSIDMGGHDLNVIFAAFPAAGSTGSQPMWTAAAIGAFREGTISIDNPGKIYLESRNNYYYGSAIRASTAGINNTGAHVVINNDNSKEHAVTIRGGIDTPSYELNWRALEAVTFYGDKKENANTIDIKGLVDIETKYAACMFARQGYSEISVGGGRIYAGKHESLWTAGNNTMLNVNMLKDEDGNVIGAGDNYVQITGDVRTSTDFYGEGGTINIGLTTPDSFLDGHFYYSANPQSNNKYNNNLWLRNGATWNNKGMVFHPWTGPEYVTSHESIINNLYGGATAETAGNISQQEAKDIKIQNLSGYVNAYLAHENGEDGNASFDALGNIVVDKATKTDGKNAGITLYTDRTGIDTSDKDKVVNTLSALGRKLVYNEAVATEDNPTPEINLDGKVGIAEGLTAGSVAIRLADLDFNKENGEGSLIAGSIHTPDAYVPIMYGSKETAMMKGAKSAMASTAMLWRAENNDLMKRMGDLRLSEGERGLWAKYYGGKYEMDSQNTDFNLKYNAYQLGYDADAGNGWTVGAAVSYNDGDATYGNGRGDLSAYSAGIYGTWKSEDGQYVDIIAKYSKLENDYKVFNDGGHKLSGDYKTWGTSISAEYGKRFENDNGFYFDPSVELTLGRINGKDYNAHSDYLDSIGVKKDMQVEQDAFNTLVGRVGFRLGQKLDNASYFVKLAAAHEFSGDFDTTFRAVNEPEGRTSIDFGDTWYEAQIGGTAKLSKNSLIYADFERSFGGDVEEKWRVDAGLRFTF